MRKKIFLPFLAMFASLSLLNSCSEDGFSFDYDLKEYEFCYAAMQFEGGQEFTFIVTQSDIQDAFNTAGASLENIENAQLDNLKLVVTDSGKNLDQIAGVQVYVRDVGSTAQGEQIAYFDNANNTSGETEVLFSLNGTELKNWLTKSQFQLRVLAYNNQNDSEEVCMKLSEGRINITVTN